MPPESAEALLHALLGTDQTLEPLTRVLIARTEGNPFFLEESVQALVETQVLVGQRGAYRLAKHAGGMADPRDGAGDPRRAHRPARARGEAPPSNRIGHRKGRAIRTPAAIADASDDDLRRGLAHLQRAEFLYETSLFPDLEYTFKHALTHEVAYGSLLHDRRRASTRGSSKPSRRSIPSA